MAWGLLGTLKLAPLGIFFLLFHESDVQITKTPGINQEQRHPYPTHRQSHLERPLSGGNGGEDLPSFRSSRRPPSWPKVRRGGRRTKRGFRQNRCDLSGERQVHFGYLLRGGRRHRKYRNPFRSVSPDLADVDVTTDEEDFRKDAEEHNEHVDELLAKKPYSLEDEKLEVEAYAKYLGLPEKDYPNMTEIEEEVASQLANASVEEQEALARLIEPFCVNRETEPYAEGSPDSQQTDSEDAYGPKNIYKYPRAYVEGHGPKDWRGKSPEYSDPDLPKLEDVLLTSGESSCTTEVSDPEPIPNCVGLCYLREHSYDKVWNPYHNFSNPNTPQIYKDMHEKEKYFNDSWSLDYLLPQLKHMERRIRYKYGLSRVHLCSITNERPQDEKTLIKVEKNQKFA